MQASSLIVSVSGIRGIIGESLTPAIATTFAEALGTTVGGGRMILSRDGRPSGVVLRHAVLAGLLGTGCDVHDLGVAPTPTCGFAVRKLQAAGGMQITASHNPAEWNGLKLFGADGMVLSAVAGQKIKEMFEAGNIRRAAWNGIGRLVECADAGEWHLRRVVELIDAPLVRSRQFRVLLDANGGAGGIVGRRLLEDLHCQPISVGCEADGNFQHEPEPILANLLGICPQVAEQGADIGFVLDPDSDRLAVVDEKGSYIGEELTLALALRYRLSKQSGPVVVNMSTSRVNEDVAKQFGSPFHRSAVGEANVCEKMREVGAVIGGEGNGGVIDPRVGWVRDPFIGIGLILNLMAETGKKLSEIVADLPAYTIVKDKHTVDRAGLPALYAALAKRWPEAIVNRVDGLRLDWSDCWLHVRPSNTEPIVRVIAEAPKAEDAKQLCREVGELL